MPLRELEISVAKDGTVEVHLKGYKGKRCLDAVNMLEKMVGEINSQQKTSEFYEPDEEVTYRVEQRH